VSGNQGFDYARGEVDCGESHLSRKHLKGYTYSISMFLLKGKMD